MKRFLSVLLALVLVLSASAALATNAASGELVTYQGSVLRLYDIAVFQASKNGESYRGLTVGGSVTPDAAITTVLGSVAQQVAAGTLVSAKLVGLENVIGADAANVTSLPLESQAAALATLLAGIDPASITGEAFDAAFAQTGTMSSAKGTLTLDGVSVPFIRVTIEMVYAATGSYADRTEAQRTFYENYNFAYVDGAWKLIGIVNYAPAFFAN